MFRRQCAKLKSESEGPSIIRPSPSFTSDSSFSCTCCPSRIGLLSISLELHNHSHICTSIHALSFRGVPPLFQSLLSLYGFLWLLLPTLCVCLKRRDTLWCYTKKRIVGEGWLKNLAISDLEENYCCLLGWQILWSLH